MYLIQIVSVIELYIETLYQSILAVKKKEKLMIDQRKDDRHDTFWTVSKNDQKTNKEEIIGYILNFSKSGIELWVDKNNEIENFFHIRIYPPLKVDSNPIEFDVECKWKKNDEDNLFYTVGCQFKNLTHEKQKEINKLSNNTINNIISPTND